MIPFAFTHSKDAVLNRIQDRIHATFILAVAAKDIISLGVEIFKETLAGSKTLTLGTTAPDSILTTTPTRWITVIEPDGQPTIIPGWR
jgi:hypothetical protein